jgi:stress response protein YsnF
MDSNEQDVSIPVIEERARLNKVVVDTAKVRIRTETEEYTTRIYDDLLRDVVDVKHVAIDQEITSVPEVRTEGNVLIIPVVEEVLVVQKKMVLKEEIHLARSTELQPFAQKVTLRKQHAVVERQEIPPTLSSEE